MSGNGVSAARPSLIREMNEQVLLDHLRRDGPLSRAELARLSGLSKPTVSLGISNIERAGLVRVAGFRRGVPGAAATLYEVRPEAGFAVGLDVGRRYLRGAIVDLTGETRARCTIRARATSGGGRVSELKQLTESLVTECGLTMKQVVQTVIGSPGVYDPARDALSLTGSLRDWESPSVLAELRGVFGANVMVENDIDAAAFAERTHGHGQSVDSFAFVSVGTGIGMGLVINGKLHRGAHGAAGEIAYLPFSDGNGVDLRDAHKRGLLEAAASAAAVVRRARRAGIRSATSAETVFSAASAGDASAAAIVAEQSLLVAKACCAVITVVDPQLIVLGGGIGQAPGFVEAVTEKLHTLAPVTPDVKVSVLGVDAVVGGCLALGVDRAWELVTATLPAPPLEADTRQDR